MLTVEREQLLRELKSVQMFRNVGASALERLAEIAEVRVVPAGEVLFRQGDPGDEMVVLVRGSLRITAATPGTNAGELCLAVAKPGEVIGEMALLDGQPRNATVTSTEDCQVLSLGREAFLELLREQPDIAIVILHCMAQRVRYTTEHATDIAQLDVYQRLLRQFKRLAHEHGTPTDDGVVIDRPLTIETLATMVAARQNAVERLVCVLEGEGVLKRDGTHWHIYDVDRLTAHATPLMY